jgi:hypothetical protein
VERGPILLFVGLVLAAMTVTDLLSGRTLPARSWINRDRRPILYWAWIAVLGSLAAITVAAALREW